MKVSVFNQQTKGDSEGTEGQGSSFYRIYASVPLLTGIDCFEENK